MLRDEKSSFWKSGRITEKLEQPRSYMVQIGDGKVVRRNVRDIRDMKAPDSCFEVIGNEIQSAVNHHQDQREANPEDDEELGRPQQGRQSIVQLRPSTDSPIRTRSGRIIRSNRNSEFEYY